MSGSACCPAWCRTALLSAYELASEVRRSRAPTLVIEEVPVAHPLRRLSAGSCNATAYEWFSCEVCGTPAADVIRGRELELSGTGAANDGPRPRLVEVRQHLLKKNDLQARALRDRFRDAGVFVVSLVSSPGPGKTAFLERTLTALARNIASPPSSATSPPRTTPPAWRAAVRR